MSFESVTTKFTTNQSKALESLEKQLIKSIADNLFKYKDLFPVKVTKKALEEMCRGDYDADSASPKKATKSKKEESEDDEASEEEADESEALEEEATEEEEGSDDEEKDENLSPGVNFTDKNLEALKAKLKEKKPKKTDYMNVSTRHVQVKTDKNAKNFLWDDKLRICINSKKPENVKLFKVVQKKLSK